MNDSTKLQKQDIEDIMNLSPVQEGMLFHYLSEPESELYFEQLSFNLTGAIDILIVKKAWEQVTKANEMLRAVYRWQKLQRPVQIILKNHVVPFIEYDLTELPEHEKQASLERIKIKDRGDRIDLSLAPMRILFCTLGEHKYQMILSHYHIILDGWSNGVLLKEFLEAYNAISDGKQPYIPVKSKYRQFIKWHKELDRNRHIEYWKKHLAGFDNKTLLPFDRKKGEGSVDTESYICPFDEGLTDEIKYFVTNQKITAATLLYTSWGVLLHKYNDSTDVVFGTTVSGRSPEIPGVESMVGLLINTIPLRIKSNAGQTISELLAIANSELRERSEYECTPLIDIKTGVELDRTENIFDSIVVIENYPIEMILDNSKKFSIRFNSIFEMTNYELTLVISMFDKIELRFIYDANVFNQKTIERMSRHFENIIKSILINHDIKISEIDMLTEDEKRNILFGFNNTYLEYPREMVIHRLFEEQAQRTPENIAVVFGESALTYRELNNKANILAEVLIKQGVAAKSIVGIMMDKSPEMVVSLLAILKCGAAYLPIDISYPRERILYMLGDSNVKFFITTSEACKDIPFTLLQNIRPDNNGIIVTKTREHIKEFNKLPLPDRSLIDITKYKNKIGMASVNNCISLQTTRGCPYQCIFCHKVWSKQHVYRSAENIYNEIEYYYKKGVTNFSILDDCFNLNMENGKRLFKMLINNRIKVRIFFPNGLRGDILTRDYIDLMAEAGVVNINLSLETASPRLQVLVKKYLDLEKFKNVIKYIAGQHPNIILELATMHGFPTETEEEAMLTLNFIKDIKWIHFPYIHILKIYPNTEMEEFALKNGVLKEDILRSVDLAYHEIPETLPFPKSFTRRYQAEFLNDYFLRKERLKQVLPVQMKILSKSAIIEKYRTYLPVEINSIEDVLKFADIDDFEMPADICTEDSTKCSYFNDKQINISKSQRNKSRKILFLDLSQHFSSHKMLYKVIEQPLGQLYILTYLNEQFGDKIEGRIYKSGIDFDSFDELKEMIKEFKPELIGIRTLSLYKEFFHQIVSLLRQWGVVCPILAGGPYATSDYNFILQDSNVDIAVLGEGEFTLRELIGRMLENDFKIPDRESLKSIDGIAFNLHTGANSSYGTRKVMFIDQEDSLNENGSQAFNPDIGTSSEDLAYVMYTSGSTGKPKGVMVEHRQVNNCIYWMQQEFNLKEDDIVLQRTNLTFDPSVWELFWPLYMGAVTKLITIDQGKDAEYLIDLMRDGSKVTVMYGPASLITGITYVLNSKAEKLQLKMPLLFIGAEPISRETINSFYSYYKGTVVNTYGPTECTINNTYCYLEKGESQKNVPIGKPVANNKIYILSKNLELLPLNIPGEIYIEGESVARGYINNIEKTNESFIKNPFGNGRLYKTGDIGKWLEDGNIEIMGRADQQVKIRGYRIELSEIEAAMMKNKSIIECAVIVKDGTRSQEPRVCKQCGINSSYPNVKINEDSICNICEEYSTFKKPINNYFKTLEELDVLLENGNKDKKSDYDCILLYSGGKGSAYALYQLVERGCKVLALTYDNGYFSAEDRKRIKIFTEKQGVDHVFLKHNNTDKILKESMESAGTVCKGCFFTSSSLAAEYAKKHNISVVIGATLSRGQIIENKLYNLLKQGVTDAEEIEKKLSDIQRLTGEMNENIFEYIDIDSVKDGTIYDKVKTVDFYRYCDVTNAEMLSYLNSRDSYWEKRKNYAVYSTNCPIKQIGDYEHLHKKGYHYYGSATSWEKRLGHITLKDIEQDLQCNVKEQAVNNFKRRLDLERSKASGRLESKFICAYYTSDTEQTVSELREYLINEIPEYMVPSYFIRLEKIPLTPEGKVNKNLLPEPEGSINTGVKYAAPESAIEEKLTQIWEEILGIERVGCNDNFFELGGHSLKATILVSRVHKEFNVELPLREIFKTPTIKELSKCIISGKQNLFEPIRELEKKEYYQLSSAQMRLFIINKYEDVGLSYNMSEVKLIEGCLDPDKLEKSLKELINRHEALRTSFQIIDGEPMQKINSEVAFNISHIDIGQSTVEDVDNKLEEIIKVFVRPFDLSEAPLIRVGLVKLSEEKHIFIIDMHHIISDGTSVGILTRDIEALLNGRSLPPMKVQFKDYAAWQKELLKKDFIKRQEEYWMEILSGELPVLNLPADFERPSVRSFDGDRIEFVISEEMTVGLKKLASETNATLYMILMSVYNILLSKYANQEDIIIGTPVAGRQHADVENMMGMFVNTLVMRNYPQGNKTFKEFLEEVKNYALKAFENQDYPLDELIHKLKLRKDPSRNPLFDTIFVLQNTAIKEIETENLKFSRYATKNRVSKFDVSLEITEQENKLNCVLEYCTKLFSKDSMELMSRDYEEILNKILEDRTIKLSEIELSKRYQMRESVLTDDIEFNF